jgi:uncharacterized membrane protein|tara:strand:+ start:240 stop:584 length:345 start_codon:yes stop_codon:yes gene_type:complete
MDNVYPVALQWGNKTCHQAADRSFHIGVRKFPVCARCTGIYAGALASVVISFWLQSPILFAAMLLPMILDGTIQYFTKYRSTNTRRFVTGAVFGYGAVGLVASAVAVLIRIIGV